MTAFLAGLGFSAVAIFIAEMGDKTQLVAMSLATRYRALTVLLGITAATLVVHAGSVLHAEVLGAANEELASILNEPV
ncbi:TMEM165/GDT1 family protein, partial [Nocardiopsis tropica]|nr:TMEM165/GDT1 family protein [Nocardiopsis tropica]